MKMIQNEWYGELPASLFRLVKRYNVSPSDYVDLEYFCNEDFDRMAKAIVACSRDGYFSSYELYRLDTWS